MAQVLTASQVGSVLQNATIQLWGLLQQGDAIYQSLIAVSSADLATAAADGSIASDWDTFKAQSGAFKAAALIITNDPLAHQDNGGFKGIDFSFESKKLLPFDFPKSL